MPLNLKMPLKMAVKWPAPIARNRLRAGPSDRLKRVARGAGTADRQAAAARQARAEAKRYVGVYGPVTVISIRHGPRSMSELS